jgi:2'-5' RNA ligase
MQVRSRYFIAAIPPSPLLEQALTFKQYFRDNFHSKASLNSPPHITLHMPFEWRSDRENELVDALQRLSAQLKPAAVQLMNFGCFDPRVIFLSVVPSTELNSLQSDIRRFCKTELGLFNADYRDQPFHPHITLAFRDLKKPMFAKAWEEFKDKTFSGDFLTDRISLLKHDGKEWRVMKEFSLIAR